MKTLTNITYPAFALFAFACFALLPNAKAVVPTPDGGYPNQNTAEGQDALFSLTTGTDNTAIDYNALYTNSIGYDNTAVGNWALKLNTTGITNTAVGSFALSVNTTGSFNTAMGFNSLGSNMTEVSTQLMGKSHCYATLGHSTPPSVPRLFSTTQREFPIRQLECKRYRQTPPEMTTLQLGRVNSTTTPRVAITWRLDLTR